MSGTPPNPNEGGVPTPTPSPTPASLLQLAPKSVRLLHKNEPLPMRKGRYSILTGKPFEVVVIPQSPDDRVEITADAPIQQTSNPHKLYRLEGVAYESRFFPKLARQPFPHTVIARVRVTISRLGVESRQLKFAIRIRPTIRIYFAWVLLLFAALAAQRLSKFIFDTESIEESLTKIRDDLPVLVSRLGLSSLVIIPVYLIGLILTTTTDTGEDD